MTEAIIILGALCLALVVLLFTERRRADAQATAKNESFQGFISEMDARHIAERRELLNRIQHPHVMPTTPARTRQREPKDKSQLAKVGTISPPKPPE